MGVQNATAVQLPIDIELTATTTVATASEDFIFIATHNARNVPWGQRITITTSGRHRILAAVTALGSICSRTDFFVFDGYLAPESSAKVELGPSDVECLTAPEFHLLIFWSAMPESDFSRLLRTMTALSDIANYPEANYHVRLQAVLQADPGVGHRVDENWYREFYGSTYYGLYFGTSDRVDMVRVKGDGAFHIALVEDLCPKYAYDLKRNMVLNTNMFALKNLLREHSSEWYQVHTTQTANESDANYKFLFGETGREIFKSIHLAEGRSALEYESLRVEEAAYILPWRRVFIIADAMEVLGAMMQSEWYRFELDVPEIHAELTPGMLNPDLTSSVENIHRAAFLGSTRLPLLAHLPTDSRWYKGKLELKRIKKFRVLKENSWGQQLPSCCTVGDAAAILRAQDTAEMIDRSSLHEHIRQLQHRVDHFDHTLIVIGSSVDGPFTIWDGNHRAIALALTQPDSHLLLVYLGISSKFALPHRVFYCP
ncbi:hypothetical protein V7S43_007058 [Phytophthora oleae]|uniref:Uncharacterized protein n=1 Tax=Phytophthora oleae TaxID=2107226 RepID=A0ABD3FQP8_9STRA